MLPLMTIHILNAKKVADDISKNAISSKEKSYYLLGTFLVFIPFYYSGFVYSNPLWSWLSMYEALVVAVINVVGLNKAYEAAGGESNQNFVTEFTCLYVPVSVTTISLVWLSYWVISYAFRESLIKLSSSHLEIAMKLSNIGSDLFGLLIFLASVLVPFITFYRIKKLFHVIERNRD